MSLAMVNNGDLTTIADAIRVQLAITNPNYTPTTYKPNQFPIMLSGLNVIKCDYNSLLNRSLTYFEENTDITSVREYGFAYCTAMHTVILGNCITLNNNAFYNCTNLATVSIPKCTTIGASAFASCIRLVNITLPKVTNIGNYAFSNCGRLKVLTLEADSVATLGTSALDGTLIYDGIGVIKVPSALVDSYKSASGWNAFASQIEAIS